MSFTLVAPTFFKSPRSGLSTHYVLLKPNTQLIQHVVLFCYGSGGRSVDLNRFQNFVASHASLTMLCIDRWAQGSSASRDGPGMLREICGLMAEILDLLGIGRVSLAFHSAGAYQALTFAAQHTDRVNLVFPLCAHVSFAVTESRFLNWLTTRAPPFLLTIAERLDGGVVGQLVVKYILTSPKDDRVINPPEALAGLEAYVPSQIESQAERDRSKLDYIMCFGKCPGYPAERALDTFYDCPKDLVWFTTTREMFFGPHLVQKLRPNFRSCEVECISVEDALHANIHLRKDVWAEIYRRILLYQLQFTI